MAWVGVIVKSWIDEAASARAAAAFRDVDDSFNAETQIERAKRLMSTAKGRSAVANRLYRYFSLELEPGTLQLLSSKDIEEQHCAVIGLISANAGDKSARAAVLALLRAANDSELRQLIAEYSARLCTPDDLSILNTALSTENNAYVKSALEAAVSAINSRAAAQRKLRATLSDRWSALSDAAKPSAKLALCLDILTHDPGTTDFAKAWTIFRDAADNEPRLLYGGDSPPWHECFRQRNALERLLLFAPCGCIEQAEEPNFSQPAPVAEHFMPPIDAYFNPQRASYGHSMGSGGVFGDSVHVGDDCGWRRELQTIVSIGNGRVCRAAYVPSWGHILIIEHRLKDGNCVCSLYAHTSPFLYVKPGDSVVIGQKIATIGRANTVENGGYGAHLHFGIHHGPYDGGIWISGYVGTKNFIDGRHAWQNPQEFLQKHR